MNYAHRILSLIVIFLSIACHQRNEGRSTEARNPVVAEVPVMEQSSDTGTGSGVEIVDTGLDTVAVTVKDTVTAADSDTSTVADLDTETETGTDTEPEPPNYCTVYTHQLDAIATDDGGVVLTLQVDDADETLVATIGADTDAAEIQIASDDTERVLMVTVAADGSVVSVNRVEEVPTAENVNDDESVDSDGTSETAIAIFSPPQPDGVGCAELTQLNAQQTDSGMDVLVMVQLNELLPADSDTQDTDSLDTDSALECHFAFADDSDTEPAEGASEWNSLFYYLRLDDTGALVEKQRLVNATDATPVFADFHNGGATLAMNAVAMEWGEAAPVQIRKDERFPGTQTGAVGRFDTTLSLINSVETTHLQDVSRTSQGEMLLQFSNAFPLLNDSSTSPSILSQFFDKYLLHEKRGLVFVDDKFFFVGKGSGVFLLVSEDLAPQRILGGHSNSVSQFQSDYLTGVYEIRSESRPVDVVAGQTKVTLNPVENRSAYYWVSQDVSLPDSIVAGSALRVGPVEVDTDCVWREPFTDIGIQCPSSVYESKRDAFGAAQEFISVGPVVPIVALGIVHALPWMEIDCIVRCQPEETCALKANCTSSKGADIEFYWRNSRNSEEYEYPRDWSTESETVHEVYLSVTLPDGDADWTGLSLSETYAYTVKSGLPGEFSGTGYELQISWLGNINEQLTVDGFYTFSSDNRRSWGGGLDSSSSTDKAIGFDNCDVRRHLSNSSSYYDSTAYEDAYFNDLVYSSSSSSLTFDP